MIESQESITKWANETFGLSTSNMRVAARANEEMAQKALDECADVFIVLCRVVSNLGGDFQELIDRKMEINRARTWNLDGSGHGYHVRAK
jgi:hypothetical protein